MGDPREIWQLKSLVKMFIGVWGWGGGIRVRGRGEKGVLEEVGREEGIGWDGLKKSLEERGGEERRTTGARGVLEGLRDRRRDLRMGRRVEGLERCGLKLN